ncbi:YphA family membrane protein [Paenibacillus roseipurpureus]|uniref:Uncharacterized protein n=1 Tax=Paenibacillus roseopurpureus TaxID=2918901 RepID=A0AA96LK89_9BACL|nr:hypothetical protein [Paenibacillus sp. MBLB1832]WNR42464.1 hypothetical protein MJB10_15140 [Paenibacillus sp. MBLB1832]
MNAGYLSLILLCIMLILLASGWKELYIRSISHKGMLLFFVSWLIGMRLTVVIRQVHIQVVYFVVLALALLILYVTQGFIHKLHLLSIGLLLGSLHFLVEQLLVMDPILIVRNSAWQSALVLALVAVVLQRNAWEQIGAISIGYLLGDLYQSGIHKVDGNQMLGLAGFQDQWWLTVFTARTITIMVQFAYNSCRSVWKQWMNRNGSNRE